MLTVFYSLLRKSGEQSIRLDCFIIYFEFQSMQTCKFYGISLIQLGFIDGSKIRLIGL